VPKDHLLVRQMGLTKVAAVFAFRRIGRLSPRDPRQIRLTSDCFLMANGVLGIA
jgi:hypothetical protein